MNTIIKQSLLLAGASLLTSCGTADSNVLRGSSYSVPYYHVACHVARAPGGGNQLLLHMEDKTGTTFIDVSTEAKPGDVEITLQDDVAQGMLAVAAQKLATLQDGDTLHYTENGNRAVSAHAVKRKIPVAAAGHAYQTLGLFNNEAVTISLSCAGCTVDSHSNVLSPTTRFYTPGLQQK